MKTNRIYNLLLVAILSVATFSCVQDDDWDTPDTSIEEPNLDGDVISLTSMYGEWEQAFLAEADDLGLDPNNPADQQDLEELKSTFQYTFEDTTNYTEGFVISTDEAGNFFREIIIQDQAENPEIGVRIGILVNPLFTRYEVGRKIYVKLQGFTLGNSNGVLTLGIPDGPFIDEAPAQFEDKILRSSTVEEIVPLELSISEFSDEYENLFIKLTDMQFLKSDVLGGNSPISFASESYDEFDGERVIQSCTTGAATTFSTSTFADFSSLSLPEGKGSISGVLLRNFENSKYIIAVNTLEDVNMTGERCDPEVLECTGTSGGTTVLFEEDFSYSNISQLEATGWVNTNIVNASGEDFVIGSFSNNSYAQISGFNSGEDDIQTYLISPSINLDSTSDEQLMFDLEVAFANANIMSVLITNDYTGDPSTTEWITLDVSIPNEPSSGFGGFDTYEVNISCLEGDARVAFFYEGSDPSATTRYHIDNFEINGN